MGGQLQRENICFAIGALDIDSIKSDSWDGKTRTLYPRVCENCRTTFFVPKHVFEKARYCSKTCDGRARLTQVEIVCDSCGKHFWRKPSQQKNSKSGLHFCSRKCKELSQRIGGRPEIQPNHYKDGAASYRSIALRSFENACVRCGYKEDVRMLDVDHIDNNRKNGNINNLRILCVWCHALKTRNILLFQIGGWECFGVFAFLARKISDGFDAHNLHLVLRQRKFLISCDS